jgi:glycosyltransferase involved in cell wall biosynthesis
MAGQPVLSVCVPSRNRQIYFQETIRALTETRRADIQFVFADNSDDPSVMNAFMEAYRSDPRITYLPSGERTYSMMENWERAVAAADGKWVSAIGDDDYLDPDVAGLLLNLEAKAGPVDALTWAGFNYIWPDGKSAARPLSMDLGARITRFDQRDLMRRAFNWEGSLHVPLCGNSLYHGAISRDLLHTIRRIFGGRFFEFPIIDYEIAFKVILTGKHFYNVSRPFSILGVCPLSNSATMGNMEAEDQAVIRFNREVGYNINADPLLADTPFRTTQGTTASILVIQHWLSRKYGFVHSGYEQNLVRALAMNCEVYTDRASFDIICTRYRDALGLWHGGQYLDLFKPTFRPLPPSTSNQAPAAPPWCGLDGNGALHFAEDAGGAETPGELFSVLRGLMIPADAIDIPD